MLHFSAFLMIKPMMSCCTELGGNFGISLTNEHAVRAYHEKERQNTRNILDKYLVICGRAGVLISS